MNDTQCPRQWKATGWVRGNEFRADGDPETMMNEGWAPVEHVPPSTPFAPPVTGRWECHPSIGYAICLPGDEYIDLSVSLTVCKSGDRHEREHALRNYIVACVNQAMAMTSPDVYRNFRVQARYDELRAEGKHGHYETLFRVVREEVDRASLYDLAQQALQRQAEPVDTEAWATGLAASVFAKPEEVELQVCPDGCYRPKARNANDCMAGCCSKWYAIRDPEAVTECATLAAFWKANPYSMTDDEAMVEFRELMKEGFQLVQEKYEGVSVSLDDWWSRVNRYIKSFAIRVAAGEGWEEDNDEFVCPECGGGCFGSDTSTEPMTRYCHGYPDSGTGCGFSWTSADDGLYFYEVRRRPWRKV